MVMILPVVEFIPILVAMVFMFYFENVDPEKKPREVEEYEILDSYDFIVVGAGSAGCVVASRLSEEENWNVLLIEAGGDEDAVTDTPFMKIFLQTGETDWNYNTTTQHKACQAVNGQCRYPRGKVLGGSSTTNGMAYVRGNPRDYDDWADQGNPGWSYHEVLKYFKKLENYSISDLHHLDPKKGTHGPQSVQLPNYSAKIAEYYLQATEELGYEVIDYNGYHQIGVGRTQSTMYHASRASTAKAYLNPVRYRRNLHILKNTEVTQLLIDGSSMGHSKQRVAGVLFKRKGRKGAIRVNKEVILSAGTINSPKLLMLSGIGPKEHLRRLGIPVMANLPVGDNLQDHLCVPIYVSIDKPIMFRDEEIFSKKAALKYAKHRTGPLSTSTFEALGFFNVFDHLAHDPNVEWHLNSFRMVNQGEPMYIKENVLSAIVVNLTPSSIGSVRLKSANPKDDPLIDPNYLSDEIDMEILHRGIRLIVDFFSTPTFASLNSRFYLQEYQNCRQYVNDLDRFIDCIIIQYSGTIFHPVGTCKMGPKEDRTSVVSPELIVHGFDNLRVIDASIMPNITRGNTNGPTIMIGEKGADLIKERYKRRNHYRFYFPQFTYFS